jgi:hypothetical protein
MKRGKREQGGQRGSQSRHGEEGGRERNVATGEKRAGKPKGRGRGECCYEKRLWKPTSDSEVAWREDARSEMDAATGSHEDGEKRPGKP